MCASTVHCCSTDDGVVGGGSGDGGDYDCVGAHGGGVSGQGERGGGRGVEQVQRV